MRLTEDYNGMYNSIRFFLFKLILIFSFLSFVLPVGFYGFFISILIFFNLLVLVRGSLLAYSKISLIFLFSAFYFFYYRLVVGSGGEDAIKFFVLFSSYVFFKSVLQEVGFLEVAERYVSIFLKLFVVYCFIIIFLQSYFSELNVWVLWAENEGQLNGLLSGRLLGPSGNPTHSGYVFLIMLFLSVILRLEWFYSLCYFLLLLMVENKLSILLSMVFLSFFVVFVLKGRLVKTFFVFFILPLLGFSAFFVIYPYVKRWSESGFKVHTVMHRLEVYSEAFRGFGLNFKSFLGDPSLYSEMSQMAFDSLPALVFVRYGLVGGLIFLFVFLKNIRSFKTLLVFVVFFMPALTMVAFYNSQYISSVFLLYVFILYYINQKKCF